MLGSRLFAIALAILPLTFSSAHAEPQCCSPCVVSWLCAMFGSPCCPEANCDDARDQAVRHWRDLWTAGRFAEAFGQIERCKGCDLETRHARIISQLVKEEVAKAKSDCCCMPQKVGAVSSKGAQTPGLIRLEVNIQWLPQSAATQYKYKHSKDSAARLLAFIDDTSHRLKRAHNLNACPDQHQRETQSKWDRFWDEQYAKVADEAYRRLIAAVREMQTTPKDECGEKAEASDSARLRSERAIETRRPLPTLTQPESDVSLKLTAGTNQMHIVGPNFKAHCRQISKSTKREEIILDGNVVFETTVLGRTLVIHSDTIRVDMRNGAFQVGDSLTIPENVYRATPIMDLDLQRNRYRLWAGSYDWYDDVDRP